MPTGDGLLVRLLPIGTIPLDAFADTLRGRAAARQRHHRSHVARQHPGSRLERGVGAAFRSSRRRARHRGRGRRSGSDQSARRPRPRRNHRRRQRSPPICALRSRRRRSRKTFRQSLGRDRRRRQQLCLERLAADMRLRAEAMNGVAALCVSVGGDDRSAVPLGASPVETASKSPRACSKLLARARSRRACARHYRGGGRRRIPFGRRRLARRCRSSSQKLGTEH